MAEHSLSIEDYHAHVYFNADECAEARPICEGARDALGVAMGRMHVQPVGPHPRGSCQLTVPREKLVATLEWLFANRGRFTVFAHGNSGNDLADHTAHVLWLGGSETLDLSQFR